MSMNTVMSTTELRVVAIADADSFVKWSASLLSGVEGIRRHMLLVRTPLTVSAAQERTALTGTSFTDADVTRLGFDEVHGWLRGHQPDVVVLSGRGPFVRLIARQIDRLARRPIVVSGLPGMSIPAQRGALEYRRESDLMVVHSHREERAFAELGRRIGIQVPTALATLPFAQMAPDAVTAASARVEQRELVGVSTSGASRAARPAPAPIARQGGTDLVFAAQALVPAARHEREQIAEMLRLAAVADPAKRVVVKLRSRPGEAEAHLERDAYADLLSRRPDNLVISHEPMSTALARAEGLVTVSSTAAIEALAQKVPVIALDMFGVHKALLNTVFTGSGLLGGAEEVVGRRFRHPLAGWQRDNYFHPQSHTNWWRCVEELVALRREGRLRAKVVPTGRGGALHAAWHRKSVLAGEDRSLLGSVALGVGAPLVNGILSMRRARGKAGEDTWSDATTDYTLEPTPHHDPIRR
ncbi:DUF6716 putative glycosyltransferase [Microbacterium murale]|nr:DUF6716 putative glycosyltransferase [Microbacterium murale]